MKAYLQKYLANSLAFVWMLLWFVLSFWSKGTVIAIWVLAFVVIVNFSINKPKVFSLNAKALLLFALFFIWQFISVLIDNNIPEVLGIISRKLSFIIIPFLMLLEANSIKDKYIWATRGLYLGLTLSGLFMILVAFIKSIDGFSWQYWMYHEFTSSSSYSAIYYSCFLTIAIICLLYGQYDKYIHKYKFILLSLFFLLLLLSASKLFIIIGLPFFLYALFLKVKLNNKKYLLFGLLLVGILFSRPIYVRLKPITNTDLNVVFLDKYNYDTHFNGLTLRLLQWRFALEIIQENKSWIYGVGIAEKKHLLDDKYVEYKLYTGNSELGDKGYLGYNFHNQFVETWVGMGTIGLILLLFLIFSLFFIPSTYLLFPLPVYIVFITFFFTETVLGRQPGVVLFSLLFSSFLIPNYRKIIKND